MMRDCTDQPDQYQTLIMNFYLTGVKLTVESMGGIEIWREAEPLDRLRVFGKVLDEHPLDIAVTSLCMAAYAVPLHDIFSDTTPLHLKLQK